MKKCPKCCEVKPESAFWKRGDGRPASRCKECSVLANKEWRQANPGYEKARYENSRTETRERHLIRKYGVNLAQYKKMLDAQNGKCAICGALEKDQFKGVFHVDHCHISGAVRGLLCRGCNHVLGHLKDDPTKLRNAIQYLRKSPKSLAAQSCKRKA